MDLSESARLDVALDGMLPGRQAAPMYEELVEHLEVHELAVESVGELLVEVVDEFRPNVKHGPDCHKKHAYCLAVRVAECLGLEGWGRDIEKVNNWQDTPK